MDKLDEILKEWKTPENKLSSERLFSKQQTKRKTGSYWKWALSLAACLIVALGIYISMGGFYPLDKEGPVFNPNTNLTKNNTQTLEYNMDTLPASGILDGTQSDIICYALLMDVPNEK